MTGVLTQRDWRTQAYELRDARRPTPYLILGTLFWAVVAYRTWQSPLASDFGQHAAAIERIAADWLHPANPLLDVPGTGSPYFTPYTVVLGLLSKVTGVPGWQLLKGCGPVNLALIVTGIGAFTRVLSRRRWAPVLALAAFVLLWGPQHKEWSGFLGLQSMIRGLTYPSAFAVGVTFWVWALTARAARRGVAGTWLHAWLGLLIGTVLLVHPFTAMGTVIGVLAIVIGMQRMPVAAGVLGRWALTGAVAFAVAAWWPYFSLSSLLGDPTVDDVHRRLYANLWQWYGLALAGLPALLCRLRVNRFDPLVLMFAADCAVAAYGWLSGSYSFGRIFGLLLVPLQFALAVELAGAPPWTGLRRVLAPLAAVAACAGLLAQAGAVVPERYVPPALHLQRLSNWPGYLWAQEHIAVGDVLLTDGYNPKHVMPAYGAFLVSPTWPDPSTTAADRERREADVRAYLAPATPVEQRLDIARRYHVKWVMTEPGEPSPPGGVQVAQGPRTGERLYRVG
ncbi:hypothetical protein ABZZ36_08200 [Actinacidiphila glaucinigra]|uniref:hypothetical protein n=1 Tax=Actinacidiphila glaucinigra TaxID=235986 RepID=UPI0033B2EBA1